MTLGLGMYHWGCKAYQVCLNDNPRFTYNHLTSRPNVLAYAFKW